MTELAMANADLLSTRQMIARLTRKGARLHERASDFLIVYPGERARTTAAGAADPTRRVARAVVEAALVAGWLAKDGMADTLRLTEQGALQLKAAPPIDRRDVPIACEPTRERASARGTAGPIARLAQKRDGRGAPLVSSLQAEAAQRLARDFLSGQMQPRVTSNWDRAALGFAADRLTNAAASVSDSATAAQERVRRALADAGSEFADLLVDVCCLEIGLEVIEQRRAWPPRTARIVLGLALDRLARHYGMIGRGPDHSRAGHWGDGSHRPTLARWTGGPVSR